MLLRSCYEPAMSLFTIDPNRCMKDGICAAVCPMGIIAMREGHHPEPVDGAAEICINCGHCVAVCPHGAFSLNTMDAASCTPVDNGQFPVARQLRHFIRARRSTRVYKDKAIDKKKLARIIDTARFAPTGKEMTSPLLKSRSQDLEEGTQIGHDLGR